MKTPSTKTQPSAAPARVLAERITDRVYANIGRPFIGNERDLVVAELAREIAAEFGEPSRPMSSSPKSHIPLDAGDGVSLPKQVQPSAADLRAAEKITGQDWSISRSSRSNTDVLAEIISREMEPERSRTEEAIEGRWQKAIYQLCRTSLPPKEDYLIDGGGTDSGDALDFTLAEIGQAINYWKEKAAEERREMLEALEAAYAALCSGNSQAISILRAAIVHAKGKP